jgi:hypothetical protein
MQRYLFRVHYTFPDASSSYEAVCVRAADDDEASARTEVLAATSRFTAVGVTRVVTLTLVTADA